MKTGITLITMGQGNAKALLNTLENTNQLVDEIIFGDVLIFEEDRKVIHSYKERFNIRIIPFSFDFIFKNGFSSILNELSGYATNDFVLYLNVSETVQHDYGILKHINYDYNCYYFTHETETHHWYRLYNRNELKWSGIIHEELIGEYRPYPNPLFMMADTPKDNDNEFKAMVFNEVKEIVYFNQYIRLVDEPNVSPTTNIGWVNYAKDSYNSLVERLNKKGDSYLSFKNSDPELFLSYIKSSPEFKKENFQNNNLIHFQ